MGNIKQKIIAVIGSKKALAVSCGCLTADVVALASVVPAYAAGTEVADAVTAGLGLFSATVTTLTTNPFFLAILGASLIPIGFRIFRAAKHSVV